jgi:hypothetical protein
MNKYGSAAVSAARRCARTPGLSPSEAWDEATKQLFGVGTPAQTKGCPRNAFLGLCGAGLVQDIPAGDYTRSEANKGYAEEAVRVLTEDSALASDVNGLWERVMAGEEKKHNSQMDVVAALWKEGLITSRRPHPAGDGTVR